MQTHRVMKLIRKLEARDELLLVNFSVEKVFLILMMGYDLSWFNGHLQP